MAITGAACAHVTTNTDSSTVFGIKDPCSEMPAVRERVPILLRHELYATLTASVIRLALRIYGQPGQLLARKSIVNGADAEQRAEYAQLGQQAHIYLLFYDELLQHLLNTGMRNDERDIVPQIVVTAEQLAAAIPVAQYDLDPAKRAIQARYPV